MWSIPVPMIMVILQSIFISYTAGCSDFYMNFSDPSLRLSVRTSDVVMWKNWTVSTWPVELQNDDKDPFIHWPAVHATVGLGVKWFGDEHWGFPNVFTDSMNERGLSCSVLALVGTVYEEKDDSKLNIFGGVFCHYVAQTYASVEELHANVDKFVIWGPPQLVQHFVIRDATGQSLVIELIEGVKKVYIDSNDGVGTFGIMTNEPTFDYHLTNIQHYEWKRTLARQAVALPGNFYPEERYLRIHMVKAGMQRMMETLSASSAADYQTAVSLAAQVLNTVTVPMGEQYGTDSGSDREQDHTVMGLIRDHTNQILYWRDAYNPTLRRIRLADVLATSSRQRKQLHLSIGAGPFFVDMTDDMN